MHENDQQIRRDKILLMTGGAEESHNSFSPNQKILSETIGVLDCTAGSRISSVILMI